MFLIFDWDGTLSDSAAKIVSCMQAASKDTGLEWRDDDAIRNIIGLGLPEAVRTLYPDVNLEELTMFQRRYSEHFRERDKKPSPFFPTVMETLTILRDKGYCLAVATGKSRQGLNRVLNNLKLNDFFHHSRCADETASKPDPLMLKELMEESGYCLNEAIMVGDTEWDMVMADNIGMKKIAVSYGAHSVSRLASFNPNHMIHSFHEILDGL